MQKDDDSSRDVPEAKEVTVEDADAPLVLQGEPLPPVVLTPETLIRVFRLLRERIPGFTQLSVEEERSMIRAAHLDPEFLADAMLVAEVWDKVRFHAEMTPGEMREVDGEIRHWGDFEKELVVIAKGIAGANRKRRYRLGKAALDIYFGLGKAIRDPANNHLIPYYERMKRSYTKNRKTRKKAAAPKSPPPPDTEDESPD